MKSPPCSTAQPATYLAFSPTTCLSCAEASAERLLRAQPCLISAALRVPSVCLNLQWLYSYSCKECSYILKKILLSYLVYLFTKFLGRLQSWGPYGRHAPRSEHIASWCHCTRHRTESVCQLSRSINSIRPTNLRNNLLLMLQYASVMIIQEIHEVILKKTAVIIRKKVQLYLQLRQHSK